MISAIILAGGKGKRFGSHVPKPFLSLNGKPVVQYSIDAIEPLVDEVVVVSSKPYRHYRHAAPGRTRQESVRSGLAACSSPDYVIVHDGVRPFVTPEIVRNVIGRLLGGAKSVDTAVPVVDGLLVDGAPVDKAGKMVSQTPEGFDYRLLAAAHQEALLAGNEYQDDVGLVYGQRGILPEVVEGVRLTPKLTFAKDLENAEGVLRFRSGCLTTKPCLRGKRFLVLGGSGGIGSACVRRLLAAGAAVDAPTHEGLDLSKRVEWRLDEYDGVVHSAGEYRDQDRIFAVNAMSVHGLLAAALKEGWKGTVVVLSSTAATYGRRGIALYSASKAALNSIVESMHDELAAKGIFLNAVAPAKVDTALQEAFDPRSRKEDMLAPDFVAKHVLRYLDTRVHGQIVYLRNGML